VEVDGLRLFVDVLSPEYVAAGPQLSRRRTVVLLHGGMDGDSALVRPLAQRLTEDACVVVADRRANGRSDGGGDPSTWTLERYADDVHDLCVALGIVHPIVVGSSYGGFIALQYAIRHPNHPAGLVLLASGPGFDLDALMAGRHQVDRGRDADEEARLAATASRVVRRRAVEAYPPHAFMLDLDLRPQLGAITCPLLAVIGDADPIFPIRLPEEVVAGVSSADKRLAVIPGGGHRLDGAAPDDVVAELRAFIQHIGPLEDPWAGGRTPYDEG
jgi:proline iminopeptidase